jgi:UDP:flavonoid glycosyltransferase YjiC (YdhE family)
MRVMLFGFGSRGDVQPFVALGMGLKAAGYEVAVAAGTNFKALVEGAGLQYEPIRVDVERFMQEDIGKEWLGNSSQNPRAELANMRRMTEAIAEDVADDLLACCQRADVLMSGVLTVEALHTIARVQNKIHIAGLLSPFTPTADGAAGLQAPLPRRRSFINRWFGYMIEAMLFTALRKPSDIIRQRLSLPPATRGDFIRAWNRTPTLLGVSPTIMPPPRDWPAHIYTTGFWFLPPQPYVPPPALQAFLEVGAPPVYIGFGSMSNRDPEGTMHVILSALEQSGQRGIVHSGWAGLHTADLPPTVYLLDSAPHEWLFPKMAGVVHHGGAGTTAAALRAGVPSSAVAHIGDQWFWGRRLFETGVGAAPMRRYQFDVPRLTETLKTLANDVDLRKRAAQMGERIRAEDGVDNAVSAFKQILSNHS